MNAAPIAGRGERRPRPGAADETGAILNHAVTVVARAVSGRGLRAWVVGGAIRDLLLGRPSRDLDVAVEAAAPEVLGLAAALASEAGWSEVAAHDRFGTATLLAPDGLRVDLAATRRESYPQPGALPVVSGGVSIGDDLERRDFTVHAMAREVEPGARLGTLLDPHGGKADAVSRTLRLLHERSLADDPTRAFRAAKYAVRLGFRLEPAFPRRLETSLATDAWKRISGDRLRRALEEVLLEAEWRAGLALLLDLGVLDAIAPSWSLAAREVSVRAGHARNAHGPGTLEERWTVLLSVLSPVERAAAADRLKFSKRLRRESGIAR